MLPHLRRRLRRGAAARLRVGRAVISRNLHVAEEAVRTRATAWHWDTAPASQLKALLYLTPVPNASYGCMRAMRQRAPPHAPWRMRATPPFGPALRPAALPRPWLAELHDRGCDLA